MLTKLLFALMILVIFFPMIEYRSFSIEDYIDMIRPFSGMSPQNFIEFKQSLYRFRRELFSRPQLAKQHLRIALDNAEEMSLYTSTADSMVQYELKDKIETIRKDLSTMLNKELKRNGFY